MNHYETNDLYLASYLRANDFQILDTRRDGKRITFVFEDRSNRQALIRDYYNGAGLISPLLFVDSMKNIKALVYNF